MRLAYYKYYLLLGFVLGLCITRIKASNDVVLLFQQNTADKVFIQFEEGLNSGNLELFSTFFDEKTYVSLVSGYTGYLSSSQAYYVLKDFLTLNEPLGFKLTSKVTNTSSPFASGVLRYSVRGVRSSAMVFISLKKSDDRWVISQITIN